jgi:hypothetical protein
MPPRNGVDHRGSWRPCANVNVTFECNAAQYQVVQQFIGQRSTNEGLAAAHISAPMNAVAPGLRAQSGKRASAKVFFRINAMIQGRPKGPMRRYSEILKSATSVGVYPSDRA